MLRITIDVLPYGYETEARRLGTATIFNDLSLLDDSLGNYNVALYLESAPDSPWKVGWVEDFPRQLLGPWDLLFRALAATVGPNRKGVRSSLCHGGDDNCCTAVFDLHRCPWEGDDKLCRCCPECVEYCADVI